MNREDFELLELPIGGMRSPTHSGFVIAEVASAFQKAARRCQRQEMLVWGYELFLSSRWCRSNVWNRLLVIVFEDKGIANLELAPQIIQLYLHREMYPQDDLECFGRGVELVACSAGSRLNDWAAKLYPEIPSIKEAQRGITLKAKELLDRYSLEELDTRLIAALQQKKLATCLYLAKLIIRSSHKLDKPLPEYPRIKACYIVIIHALSTITRDTMYTNYFEQCLKIARLGSWITTSKSRLIHIHLIHVWCLQLRVPTELPELNLQERNYRDVCEATSYEFSDYLALVRTIYEKGAQTYYAGVPDYALDKHTSKGKALRRGLEHFVLEGSLLARETEAYLALSIYYMYLTMPAIMQNLALHSESFFKTLHPTAKQPNPNLPDCDLLEIKVFGMA